MENFHQIASFAGLLCFNCICHCISLRPQTLEMKLKLIEIGRADIVKELLATPSIIWGKRDSRNMAFASPLCYAFYRLISPTQKGISAVKA